MLTTKMQMSTLVVPPAIQSPSALRRLRDPVKGRPDIHARVLAGKITAHAGMIEAGFRKKAPSRKQTPLEKVRRLIAGLSSDDRRSLIAELLESVA